MSDLPENEHELNAEAKGTDTVVQEGAKESFNLKKEVFEWIYTIVIALAIAFVIKAFLFDVVRVDGSSMFPTLVNNDRLIVTKLGYKPHTQDIIILDSTYHKRDSYYKVLEESGQSYNKIGKMFNYFKLPDELKKRYYVKRIIGMPGQTVDIVDGKVLVDGEVLDEAQYYTGNTSITDPTVSYPVTVQDGYVFVMGDNRSGSKDSRSSDLGQVPVDAILGKAQLRIWPLNSIGITK